MDDFGLEFCNFEIMEEEKSIDFSGFTEVGLEVIFGIRKVVFGSKRVNRRDMPF